MAKKVQRMTYDEAAAAIDAVLARLRDERMRSEGRRVGKETI